jgi:predicted RNase H-like HicB family nuclease
MAVRASPRPKELVDLLNKIGILLAGMNRRHMTMNYLVVVEKGEKGFGAYVPDLPGCVAVGGTEKEVLRLIRDAIRLHLEVLQEQGLPIPEPRSHAELIGAATGRR